MQRFLTPFVALGAAAALSATAAFAGGQGQATQAGGDSPSSASQSGAGQVSDQEIQQYLQARQELDRGMGFDQFVMLHNRIASDPSLQARVEAQSGIGRSGAGGSPEASPEAVPGAPGTDASGTSGAGAQGRPVQ